MAFRASARKHSRQIQTTGRAAEKGRILIIDDDEVIVEILRHLLERNFEVTLTTRSAHAMDWIAQGQQFDVIVCDLLMPQLTGMDLYDRLALIAPAQAKRMIFVTGGASTEQARKFLDRVANPHLEKPFDFARLMVLINARIGTASDQGR